MTDEMQQRDNSGVLFVQAERRSERSPDWKGKATVGGVAYRLSAWRKRGRTGDGFLSLAFTRADEPTLV